MILDNLLKQTEILKDLTKKMTLLGRDIEASLKTEDKVVKNATDKKTVR